MVTETLKQLMLGQSIFSEAYQQMAQYIKNYSTSICTYKAYKLRKKFHETFLYQFYFGRLPLHRYQTKNYVQSVLLVPHKGSVFDFYMSNKNLKKSKEQINTMQWCVKVIDSLNLLDNPDNQDIATTSSISLTGTELDQRITKINVFSC